MITDVIGSAHDPLLPLQRWIRYTQAELQQVRSDLQHRIEEDNSIRRAQLDSLQVQVRDLAQQQSETCEHITEIANTIAELFRQINTIKQTVQQSMNDVLRHFDTPAALPPTPIAATQPESHLL